MIWGKVFHTVKEREKQGKQYPRTCIFRFFSQVILRYETALELWSRFLTVQEEVKVWVESKLTLIVSLQSRGIGTEERGQIQVK